MTSTTTKEVLENKVNTEGDSETKRNYLKIDPPVYGQNWVVLSFVSPENLIQKKEMVYMNEFLVREVNKTLKDQAVHMVKELGHVLRQLVEPQIDKYKASVNSDDRQLGKLLEESYKKLIPDEQGFATRCLHLYANDYDELHDKYKMFKNQNNDEIEKRFDQENDNKTSLRGLKIRGIYNDRRDADDRAKAMREYEGLSAFVGPVGYWLPWDPDPDAVQDSDYMLPQLNELMKKYHDNVQDRNRHFEERKREMMENANLSNAEKKRKQLYKKLMDRKQKITEKELRDREKELAAEKKN